jgi:hypothetical protein
MATTEKHGEIEGERERERSEAYLAEPYLWLRKREQKNKKKRIEAFVHFIFCS